MSDEEAGRAAILLVDDRPEQRLSLSALLSELGDEVVTASSGREALRALLRRDFAVILLDVNMPDMDGFETAALIRQRASSQHTPIIFVTAYGDDARAAEGYSLGAVDYILAPVDPQVLKTKVGVFLELYRKTEQVRSHAGALQRHAMQLRRLADAAVAIHGAGSLEDLAKIVADTASSIVGAAHVAVEIDGSAENATPRPGGPNAGRIFLARPETTRLGGFGHSALGRLGARAVRLSAAELDAHARWGEPARASTPPLRGWLAAPLSSREGRPLGSIQLSEKHAGEFGAEDEIALVQLAQMVSIAVENALLTEAQEANRLKDQFLATLSHELRTPLQAILTWARVLRQEHPAAEVQARGMEVIERSARSQARLIEDLLDVSRIISGKMMLETRSVRLAEVIDAALEDARPAAGEKGLAIAEERAADPVVVGDPNRLRQVMGNLFSNAIKFTPRGGRITLSLRVDGADAVVALRDTGKGIAPEFVPHLFEPFRQADSTTVRSHRGLGIGLSIVRHLTELHGGAVYAESAGADQGATFVLRLPLESADPAADPVVRPTSAAPVHAPSHADLRDVRILLVEDEPDSRDSLVVGLARHGAEVVAVDCASAALDALAREPIDVLVSDLGLPGEDGYALIRRVRARTEERARRLPAIALSAYVRPEERARALLAGFDVHVAKPVEPAELAAAVRARVALPAPA